MENFEYSAAGFNQFNEEFGSPDELLGNGRCDNGTVVGCGRSPVSQCGEEGAETLDTGSGETHGGPESLSGGINSTTGATETARSGIMGLAGAAGVAGGSKPKSKRTRATGEALELLKKEFDINPNPNAQSRKRISEQTGLPEKNVRIWFQNRRAKYRKSDRSFNQRTAATDMNTFGLISITVEYDKVPLNTNENYYFIDANSLTVGSWKRLKSGNLHRESLSDIRYLSNLSPTSINTIMSNATDLMVLISKKNFEINYFFSAVANNTKILFRIFFPISTVLNCSLSLQTGSVKRENNANDEMGGGVPSHSTDGSSHSNSNHNSGNHNDNRHNTNNSSRNSNSNSNDNNTNSNTGTKNSVHNDSNASSNNTDARNNNNDNNTNENINENTSNNVVLETTSSAENENSCELKLIVSKPPKFAVYFSDINDELTSNQWSICEDFSEGRQVSDAYVGGSNFPHILTGLEPSLKFMNSLISEYNNSAAHQIMPQPASQHPQQQHPSHLHVHPYQQQQQQQHHHHHHHHHHSNPHYPHHPHHHQPNDPSQVTILQPEPHSLPHSAFFRNYGPHSTDDILDIQDPEQYETSQTTNTEFPTTNSAPGSNFLTAHLADPQIPKTPEFLNQHSDLHNDDQHGLNNLLKFSDQTHTTNTEQFY